MVQRVAYCKVTTNAVTVADSKSGLLIYVGIGKEDSVGDCDFLAGKILNLRIFADEQGQMNKSVIDTNGDLTVVSQFTLFGDVRKGRRPSFEAAAQPEHAEPLYHRFCKNLLNSGLQVSTGVFRADMKVEYLNDGPVTILMDSKKQF